MAQISSDYVNKLKLFVKDVPDLISTATITNYKVCAEANMTRKSYTKDRDRATRLGEILHADIVGPITPRTFMRKKRFILNVIDDYSRYLQVFIMSNKTETPNVYLKPIGIFEPNIPALGQFNVLRYDNGTEFTSTETTYVLNQFDVRLEHSEPFCHEHNWSN